MSKLKVIVSRAWPAEVEATLKEKYDVQLNETDVAMSKDEMKQALGNCDAFLPTVTDPVDAEVLSAEPLRARFIGNFGVGFNHIDLDAAKARGLTVTNTPEVLTDCTADIAMTLLLTAARRTSEGERHLACQCLDGLAAHTPAGYQGDRQDPGHDRHGADCTGHGKARAPWFRDENYLCRPLPSLR